jgi:hypothetical protein
MVVVSAWSVLRLLLLVLSSMQEGQLWKVILSHPIHGLLAL